MKFIKFKPFSDHNSTFEQLHGSTKVETYTPVLDDYLHQKSPTKEAPSPKRRQSLKPRPPPKPASLMPTICTIEERIENIELEPKTKTPPRPAPRKRKGILKQPTDRFDHFNESFQRSAKGYSSCREDNPSRRTKKMSGYQSEIDPKTTKSCSKRHMRRIKSSEGIK